MMLTFPLNSFAEPVPEIKKSVQVYADEQGSMLIADGRPFFVQGNWGYVPVGENYSYNFWGQSESFIKDVLNKWLLLETVLIRFAPGLINFEKWPI